MAEKILDEIEEESTNELHPDFAQCLPVFLVPFALFLFLPLGAKRFYVVFFFTYLEVFFYFCVRFYISTVRYIAWPDRIERRMGFFTRHSKSIPFDQVTEISVEQSFFQKLFKIGDIHIDTAGSEAFSIVWAGVKYPAQIAQCLFVMKKEAGHE